MNSPAVFHYWESGPSRHCLQYASSLMMFAKGRLDSVLDVGAGDGIASHAFKGRNKPVYLGIDVGAPIYERSELVRYVEDPLAIKQTLSESSAEAVMALDILEHVDDFESFARLIFSSSRRLVMISLPNEMSIHVRLRFLRGKAIPCHGLNLARAGEGHRHRWLVNYDEAHSTLCALAQDMKFKKCGEVFLTTLPRTRWKRWLLKPFLSALPFSLRSHGFALVFEKCT
jgi:hypothetical protein